jgi:oligosaccharyltransferase complex subunit delta (ribophorin II)
MARPPTSLPPTGAAPLSVSLLLGSFTHDPAAFTLLTLAVPPSAPVAAHADATLFAPRAEITHTFRSEPRVPPAPISALFVGLVVTPWAVLLGLVRPFCFPFSPVECTG